MKGSNIRFPEISVGATENILLAACFSKGKSKLSNCATEPEIQDLVIFLKKLGCKIKWTGRRNLEIDGIKKTKTATHKVIFDRIEAGTYMIAALLTNGKVKIKNINLNIMSVVLKLLKKMGSKILKRKNYVVVSGSKNLKSTIVKTKPYPGFPTDLQAQLMVLMTKAKGISKIKENIFENRFMHVSELRRMGAQINIKGNEATIFGIKNLHGAELMATDLRASVSLVLAGLSAKNRTMVNRVYHLDRGYEKIEKKLRNCGAKIKRLK